MTTEHSSVDLVGADVVRPFARAVMIAALMGASGLVGSIPIPLSPVPITLQVLFVFLAGLLLGPLWGGVSVGLYLAAGAVGAPVFAQGTSGLGVLFAETGGYLWAYLFAAVLIGLLVHRGLEIRNPADVSLPVVVASLTVALVFIYAMGVTWLSWVLQIGLGEAVILGAAYYVPGDLLKMAAAIAIVRSGAIDPT
ncbi:biotin transporter BioY [Natrialbaceae archaeon A-gly3]